MAGTVAKQVDLALASKGAEKAADYALKLVGDGRNNGNGPAATLGSLLSLTKDMKEHLTGEMHKLEHMKEIVDKIDKNVVRAEQNLARAVQVLRQMEKELLGRLANLAQANTRFRN